MSNTYNIIILFRITTKYYLLSHMIINKRTISSLQKLYCWTYYKSVGSCNFLLHFIQYLERLIN